MREGEVAWGLTPSGGVLPAELEKLCFSLFILAIGVLSTQVLKKIIHILLILTSVLDVSTVCG